MERFTETYMQLILDNIVFSLQRTGGISVVWSEIERRAAAEQDISLRVLDYPSDNLSRKEISLRQEQLMAMPYRRLERYRCPDFKPQEEAIFHSSYFRILPDAHVKNVTTIHDLTYHYYRHGPARAVHLWEEERALRHSERIICVSNNTKKDLLHFYPWLNEEKIHIVYNGVNEAFRPIQQTQKATPYEPGEYLLYVGNRSVGYKRFDTAVAVAKQLKRPLVIVGAPLSKEEESYLTCELGPGHFHGCGYKTEQELALIYSQAFCLIYLSDYEGFGIPVIEAQRCGCPVLIQRISSLPEVAGAEALYVECSKEQHIAEEAVSLLQQVSQKNLSKVIEAGLRNAQRFSWDRCYQETLNVYRSL